MKLYRTIPLVVLALMVPAKPASAAASKEYLQLMAEVRMLQDFWRLGDAVAGSSLEFSIIRKRNALPRRAAGR